MDDVTLGTDGGAPSQPYILRRAAATTVLAGIIFAGVYLFFVVYEMSLEDLLP
jgi:predicted secreted protein